MTDMLTYKIANLIDEKNLSKVAGSFKQKKGQNYFGDKVQCQQIK